jgi:NHL repeat
VSGRSSEEAPVVGDAVSSRRRILIGTVVIVTAISATFAVALRPGPSAAFSTTTSLTTGDPYAHAAGATTLAGTGTPGFNGTDQRATDSPLNDPAAVVEDASGNLYIADSGNCRVRELPAKTEASFGLHVSAGQLVTVVGGSCGGTNEKPAPSALAVDTAGDLFIAFGAANRVEELPATNTNAFGTSMTAGKLAPVAGTGAGGYNGDGSAAVRSELDDPTGLAVDADGDLLISDTANCRVRLVAAGSGTRFGVTVAKGHIYTVAGNGICGSTGDGGPALQAELWDPGAVAVDAAGDVYIADQGNRTIRVLTAHAGTFFGVTLAADQVGTVAGEGSYGPYLADGQSALGQIGELNFPSGLALDAKGDLYIADGDMHVIRFLPAATTTLLGKTVQPANFYTAAGALSTGPLYNKTTWIQTRMIDPTGLAMTPGGQLVYSDSGADVVRELPPNS